MSSQWEDDRPNPSKKNDATTAGHELHRRRQSGIVRDSDGGQIRLGGKYMLLARHLRQPGGTLLVFPRFHPSLIQTLNSLANCSTWNNATPPTDKRTNCPAKSPYGEASANNSCPQLLFHVEHFSPSIGKRRPSPSEVAIRDASGAHQFCRFPIVPRGTFPPRKSTAQASPTCKRISAFRPNILELHSFSSKISVCTTLERCPPPRNVLPSSTRIFQLWAE